MVPNRAPSPHTGKTRTYFTAMMTYLPEHLRRKLEGIVAAGYPHETCGLLMGTQNGGEVHVSGLTQARNLNTERARDRYELDPRDFLAADKRAHEAGLEIVGIWHSHPDHPARPSETDRAAAWEGYSYMIASVTRAGIADMRSFRLISNNFVEEEMTHDLCDDSHSNPVAKLYRGR